MKKVRCCLWNTKQWHLFNKRKRTVIMWINHSKYQNRSSPFVCVIWIEIHHVDANEICTFPISCTQNTCSVCLWREKRERKISSTFGGSLRILHCVTRARVYACCHTSAEPLKQQPVAHFTRTRTSSWTSRFCRLSCPVEWFHIQNFALPQKRWWYGKWSHFHIEWEKWSDGMRRLAK